MSQADLVADLKASLHDSADVFGASGDADFKRHLDVAALDMSGPRPRTMLGTLTLTPDELQYAAPADFISYKCDAWGANRRAKPWDDDWPGTLPRVRVVETAPGVRGLALDPAPTAKQIGILGATYRFYYYARHVIGASASDTTINVADRGLLILRAQAEAMREMAVRNIKKPVQLRDGLASAPKNGTPAGLYAALLHEWRQHAAA
ncbi:MAG: hypothetical protein KIT73_06800 [Burkholderiales bacterium]|nr:hypothetical protein [Burkholderiales bacterium]